MYQEGGKAALSQIECVRVLAIANRSANIIAGQVLDRAKFDRLGAKSGYLPSSLCILIRQKLIYATRIRAIQKSIK